MSTDRSAISIRDVTVRLRANRDPQIQNLNLEVARGEFVVLRAESGRGKTLLVHVLSGELRPETGEVEIGGERPVNLSNARLAALRRRVGFVFQELRLLEERTVEENIAFALELDGVKRDQRAVACEAVLTRFGLFELRSRLPRELSLGERQKTAIARAVVREPLVLIADEPTGQLDRGEAVQILDALRRENQRGMTILLLTNKTLDPSLVPGARHHTMETAFAPAALG